MDPITIVSGAVAFGRLAILLLDVYNRGFSKLQQAHEQYLEFGNAIHGLSSNLESLKKVVHDASETSRIRSHGRAGPCDLQGVDDILGDYERTIRACERVIRDNNDVQRDRGGYVHSVKWSTGLETQINRLTKRVAFHNIKILLILEPLKQKLFADIHARFDDVEDDLEYVINQQRKAANTQLLFERRLNSLFGLDGFTFETPETPSTPIFRVPPELATRFDAALARKKRFRGIDEKITLRRWLDAFAIYFQEGKTSLDLESYLRLMKSIWIMQEIQNNAEYKRTSANSLWRRYVKRLNKKLERECEQIRDTSSALPDAALVIHRPEDDFAITWDMGSDPNTNGFEDGPSLDELLNLPLHSEDDMIRKDVRVYRNINGTLLIRSSSTSTAPNDVYVLDRETDLFLDQAHLIPFYAAPSADPSIHRLLIRNGRFGTGSEFRFASPIDLLKFQEIVTDFKPVLHKSSIEVDLCMGKAQPRQQGILQLWQALQQPSASPSPSSPSSDEPPRTPSSTSSPSRLSRYSSFSTTASTSFGSMLSRRSTLTAALSSPDFSLPSESSLVFFLRSDEPTETGNQPLSLLSVCLDNQTVINPRSCQCHREPDSCTYVLLERRGGLIGRRLSSPSGLEDLNLAAVGAHQIENLPLLKGLHWVRIKFPRVADRKKFVEAFEKVRNVYLRRGVAVDRFRREIRSIQVYDKEA